MSAPWWLWTLAGIGALNVLSILGHWIVGYSMPVMVPPGRKLVEVKPCKSCVELHVMHRTPEVPKAGDE